MTPQRSSTYSFDGIVLDLRRLEASRNGERLDLEPKALRVLVYLVENRGRLVVKEELIEAVWAGACVTDNALTRVIAQIRRQLGDNARSPRFIETVSTQGYRFIAELEQTAEASRDAAPVDPAARVRSYTRWRIAAAMVVAVGVGAALSSRYRPAPSPARIAGLQQITSSAAADTGPAFSPDGGQIAFSSNRTGSNEIYVRSLAPGSAERQITSDGGDNRQPAWSPNGQEIAFASGKRGGIAVVPATGGSVRTIVDSGSNPAWSPDGRLLVYSAGSVGKITLWLAPLDGSPPRPLTRSGEPSGDHEYPKWLADGRHIIFSAFAPLKGQPWVVDSVTGQLQRIRVASDSVLFPAIAGGGRFLYFATPAVRGSAPPLDPVGVWRAELDSHWQAQQPELLIPSPGVSPADLAVTADGSRIAMSQMRRSNALWSLPLSRAGLPAGDPQPLFGDASIDIAEPAFSADGSRLAYSSLRQGTGWTIFVAAADGSSPRPITPAGQSGRMISWVGSQALAYVADVGKHPEYWIAPLDGPARRVNLSFDTNGYAFVKASPKGDRLVAHSGNRSVGIKLVLVDLATGQSRDLTPPGRTFVFPSWSPDGRWIAAVERREPNPDERVVIDIATGAIENLVEEAGNEPARFPVTWAADNDHLAFATARDGVMNLFSVSRSSRELRQLTHFTSRSQVCYGPAWSPLGDRIVFGHGDTTANIYFSELR